MTAGDGVDFDADFDEGEDEVWDEVWDEVEGDWVEVDGDWVAVDWDCVDWDWVADDGDGDALDVEADADDVEGVTVEVPISSSFLLHPEMLIATAVIRNMANILFIRYFFLLRILYNVNLIISKSRKFIQFRRKKKAGSNSDKQKKSGCFILSCTIFYFKLKMMYCTFPPLFMGLSQYILIFP